MRRFDWRVNEAPPARLEALVPDDSVFWLSWAERLHHCDFTGITLVVAEDDETVVSLRARRAGGDGVTLAVPGRLRDAFAELTRPALLGAAR